MTAFEPDNDGQFEIPTQRGRKLRRINGTLRPFAAVPTIGPPRGDIRPPIARQPKGPYLTMPDLIVDRRPRYPRKPLTTASRKLLEAYYRLNVFVLALEEMAPHEWAGERILGLRRNRMYKIQHEIAEYADLEAWFRRKALEGMTRGRIHRGRVTQPSMMANAFFIALAGGVPQARALAHQVAGNSRADLVYAADDDRKAADSEVRDFIVHSRLLWRIFDETEKESDLSTFDELDADSD